METYKQIYEKAKKGKVLKNLTPQFHDWKSDSNLLIGAYVSQAEVTGSLGDKPYNQYIFETDSGLVKFSLGGAADNEVAAQFAEGMIYSIEYLGKEEIRGGRQVNKFNINAIEAFDIPAEKPKTTSSDGKG